jgi:hypothetical protein
MSPVTILSMPHNYRDPLYEDDADWRDEDGESARAMPRFAPYVDLPIPMPACVMVITDRDGTPLAIHADGQRIRRQDVATVWAGVQQYNADLAAGRQSSG